MRSQEEQETACLGLGWGWGTWNAVKGEMAFYWIEPGYTVTRAIKPVRTLCKQPFVYLGDYTFYLSTRQKTDVYQWVPWPGQLLTTTLSVCMAFETLLLCPFFLTLPLHLTIISC